MDPLSTSTTLPPGDVFAGLASTRIEDRDSATRMAIMMGTAVAQKLLLWDDAPPSNRARRLWAFMGIHLRRADDAARVSRTFDLEHTGTLRSLLDTLGKRAGVLVARELPAEADAPVELSVTGTTLLGALDAGCAQAGCHGGQRARGELVVHEAAEPAYPAAYSGPMRIRVVELRSIRSTNFAAPAHVRSEVRLRVEWEWPMTPLSPLAIRIRGQERTYEVTAVNNLVNVGMVAEVAVDVEPAIPHGPLALVGSVSTLFEGPFDELRLAIGATATSHGLSVTASSDGDGCRLTIETTDPDRIRADVSEIGLSPMILAIATDGEESIPQIHRVRTVGSAAGSERWGLRFREGFGTIAELRLRIAAAPVRATFTFTLSCLAGGSGIP